MGSCSREVMPLKFIGLCSRLLLQYSLLVKVKNFMTCFGYSIVISVIFFSTTPPTCAVCVRVQRLCFAKGHRCRLLIAYIYIYARHYSTTVLTLHSLYREVAELRCAYLEHNYLSQMIRRVPPVNAYSQSLNDDREHPLVVKRNDLVQ